jgi:disulfide oxidoreductase YuzD
MTASYLAHTFPNQVSVEYYDAAQPEIQTQFSEAIEQAQDRYWPYPLVLIGEKIAMAGEVNVYYLSRLIRQELTAK